MEPFVLKAADLAPITTSITGNVGVLLPVGVAIMGVMLGISLIPRVVYKFF
jgi:hypothetical protein